MLFQSERYINCPYCGETQLILVDDSAGEQSYYEDCQICCAPIFLTVSEDEYGELNIVSKRDDE
jgi:hypothetical protein